MRHTLPKSHHLRRPWEFDAVYRGKTRDFRGPLTVYALPNALGHPRLGMSVSRKVGNAVRRNRIRRLVRESFRLLQHDLPREPGYDVVVVVRAHDPMQLKDYQWALMESGSKLHQVWRKRPRQEPVEPNSGPAPAHAARYTRGRGSPTTPGAVREDSDRCLNPGAQHPA